jgi:hypothetical protein
MFGKERDSGSSGLVGSAISDLSRRLSLVEADVAAKLAKPPPDKQPRMGALTTILASWPALGLVVLLLFAYPLYNLLNAVAVQLCRADEVKFGEFSFRKNFEDAAKRLGEEGRPLSSKIPRLSPMAVNLLLRAPNSASSIVRSTYDKGPNGPMIGIVTPDREAVEAIAELQRQEFVEITENGKPIQRTGIGLWAELEAARSRHRGKVLNTDSEHEVIWRFDEPATPEDSKDLPSMQWKLTDLGKTAAAAIVDAVQKQLATPRTSDQCELLPRRSTAAVAGK